jgi:septal ring factor EnvC (AmiA/AmiB activator)
MAFTLVCVCTIIHLAVYALQEYIQRRHEELQRLDRDLREARDAIEEHDRIVRARAADLESLEEKINAAEGELRLERERVRNEASLAEERAAAAEEAGKRVERVRS